ncbi:GTP cyclohydrolase I [Nonomuraea sp. NPDC050790]|uniref:GTP cyclohydrolase I n=1 Tax=Nonomuraea sp. NPDC050790 TaxID=3364371 RepID=UPI003796ED97
MTITDVPVRMVKPVLPGLDLEVAEEAARSLLAALGVDLDREGMTESPGRMVRAFAEMFTPRPFDATTFPNDRDYEQLVIERRIPFASVCEHHLMAFTGYAYVAYLPGKRILGLSKLARLVEWFARAPQVQERLTQQIADWLQENVQPKGVGVVLEAEHLCMSLRGVRAGGAATVTSAVHGVLREDPRARQEFLLLARVGE